MGPCCRLVEFQPPSGSCLKIKGAVNPEVWPWLAVYQVPLTLRVPSTLQGSGWHWYTGHLACSGHPLSGRHPSCCGLSLFLGRALPSLVLHPSAGRLVSSFPHVNLVLQLGTACSPQLLPCRCSSRSNLACSYLLCLISPLKGHPSAAISIDWFST